MSQVRSLTKFPLYKNLWDGYCPKSRLKWGGLRKTVPCGIAAGARLVLPSPSAWKCAQLKPWCRWGRWGPRCCCQRRPWTLLDCWRHIGGGLLCHLLLHSPHSPHHHSLPSIGRSCDPPAYPTLTDLEKTIMIGLFYISITSSAISDTLNLNASSSLCVNLTSSRCT